MERYGRRKEGALRSAFHRECIELKGKNILFRISRRREVVVKLTARWQSAPSRFFRPLDGVQGAKKTN